MFGLPAAALAMYMTAKPERKAIAKAILIPAALTSLLVGVTEPIEFSFLFRRPLLFVVHAVLTGIGMMLFSLFGVHAIGANGLSISSSTTRRSARRSPTGPCTSWSG